MPSEEEFVPTSADEWNLGVVEAFPLELPSGKKALVRRTLDLMTLLSDGSIPNPLREIINDSMQAAQRSGGNSDDFDMRALLDQEDAMAQFNDLLNKIVCRTVVEPPVSMPAPRGQVPGGDPNEAEDAYQARLEVWRPDPGTVSVFAVELQDKMFLFAVAQGAVADAKSFREGSTGAVPAAPDGEGVRAASKPSPRPTKRTGGGAKKAPAKKRAAKKAGGTKKAAPRKSSASKKRS